MSVVDGTVFWSAVIFLNAGASSQCTKQNRGLGKHARTWVHSDTLSRELHGYCMVSSAVYVCRNTSKRRRSWEVARTTQRHCWQRSHLKHARKSLLRPNALHSRQVMLPPLEHGAVGLFSGRLRMHLCMHPGPVLRYVLRHGGHAGGGCNAEEQV